MPTKPQPLTLTRNDLYSIDQQIVDLKKNDQALALLLSDRIQNFYTAAEKELRITNARFHAILMEHVVTDGNVMLKEDVNGKQEWKMKGSFKDDHGTVILGQSNVRDMFKQEVQKLMSQKIQIEW